MATRLTVQSQEALYGLPSRRWLAVTSRISVTVNRHLKLSTLYVRRASTRHDPHRRHREPFAPYEYASPAWPIPALDDKIFMALLIMGGQSGLRNLSSILPVIKQENSVNLAQAPRGTMVMSQQMLRCRR